MIFPHSPLLFEIPTLPFLNHLQEKYARPLSLGTIPDEEWDELCDKKFDYVWAMGVWERSPQAKIQAQQNPAYQEMQKKFFPNPYLQKHQKSPVLSGSPYAIYSYTLDPSLGQPEELAQFHQKLKKKNLKLILDFVPNHLALDHPWTAKHPECFIQGKTEWLKMHPELFYIHPNSTHRPHPQILAHGKDPFFPPWNDTVQVNFFSRELREILTDILLSLTEVCDGVRCDMAMLGLNQVFSKNWGAFLPSGEKPSEEFWAGAIQQTKSKRDDFLFIAEAYWGLEENLLNLGFDFAYDKELYDHLLAKNTPALQNHLQKRKKLLFQGVHFLENHDERPSSTLFSLPQLKAALFMLTTLPGLKLFYYGQWEGMNMRLPLHFNFLPSVSPYYPQGEIQKFYQKLFNFFQALNSLLKLEQSLKEHTPWIFISHEVRSLSPRRTYSFPPSLLCWSWQISTHSILIFLINYSSKKEKAHLSFPSHLPLGERWFDQWHGEKTFVKKEKKKRRQKKGGLTLTLPPWDFRCLLNTN